jgi:hypothetical protein
MLEMTITTKIVVGAALVFLLCGYLYMRQHARELAEKYKNSQRQKFKTKELKIIEELAAAINGPNPKIRSLKERINTSHREENNTVTTHKNPVVLTKKTISAETGTQITPPLKNENSLEAEKKALALPQTTILPMEQNEGATVTTSISQAAGHTGSMKRSVQTVPQSPPMMPPSPNPVMQPVIIEPKAQSEDLPRFVKEASIINAQTEESEGESAYPIRGQGRREKTWQDLTFKEDETLYTHINDYASWIVKQSDHFTLELYENGNLAEIIPLLLNEGDLKRLNGHWFDLFRPLNLSDLLDGINQSKSKVFCSFTKEDIEQLCKPALQIIAYVEFEASSRYETVLEECALKEFVNFLQELKSMANSDEE